MRNIKLVIEYDGAEFFGWQSQPNVRTVQDELERSLASITQQAVKLKSAGRTDTGVHALGQVANFCTESLLPTETFMRGGNALLSRDVRILSAAEVDLSFSARFSARSRSYRYVISKQPTAISRNFSWYLSAPLNVEAMRDASQVLLGENDYQSFCQAGVNLSHYRCNVLRVSLTEEESCIVFEITANRFLHNMVRIIMGTLVEVGQGKITPEDVKRILLARDRRHAGVTAPAQGLFLVSVNY